MELLVGFLCVPRLPGMCMPRVFFNYGLIFMFQLEAALGFGTPSVSPDLYCMAIAVFAMVG